MKKLTEMTDIGFKRTMTKMQKTDALIKETAVKLRCKPEDVLERIQSVLKDVEELKIEIQKLNDQL